MRQCICGEIRTSVLGFGCESVLGRVGRSDSLRAMNVAWNQGITLFDTARSYGFGEAEAVLGEFLHGKRAQAVVATKFGIDPQKPNKWKSAAVRAARKVPGIRDLFGSGEEVDPSTDSEVTRGEFTVEGLRASLECSLRQLQTDYVDVLFLHEATGDVLYQQDLMEALDRLVQAGKVRRVGLYADAEVIAEGIGNGPATLTAMQYGGNPFDQLVAAIPQHNRRGLFLIANHPFGGEQRVTRVQDTLEAISFDETVPAELREKLRGADWETITEAIFGATLNGTGVHALVLSMMQEDHLRANARAVESDRFSIEDLALIRDRLLFSPATVPGV
ncbi:MAG: aldo/keto reductase [Terracidiphilus sp.]